MSDIEQARALRDAGIQRAVDHAEAVIPRWVDRAYEILCCYLKHPDRDSQAFTSEDVRVYADGLGLPEPPHLRSWGGVFQRASRAGLIERVGVRTARAPHVHCSVLNLWRASRG